jgi:hypothetical protein
VALHDGELRLLGPDELIGGLRSPIPTFHFQLFGAWEDPSVAKQDFDALAKRDAKRQSTKSKI